jgi:transposase-like protein
MEVNANGELSMDQKKNMARLMYLNGSDTQKVIAEEVDISEQTLCKWIKEEKWDLLKTNEIASNAKQLAFLYKVFEKLNIEAETALSDDDPTTKPDADGIIKITKAIHYLKTRTGVGQMYETGMVFLSFLQKENPSLAKLVAPLFRSFIKQNL